MIRLFLAFTLLFLATNAVARPTITVAPKSDTGYPGLITVETQFYKITYDRVKQGSAVTAMQKKWDVDVRSEDYYSTHLPLFNPFIIEADPDPVSGLTRRNKSEQIKKSCVSAQHRIIKHTDTDLVLEFTWSLPKGRGPGWMHTLRLAKRLHFVDNSPAIKAEFIIENTDSKDRSVLPCFWNSASLGRNNVNTTALAYDGIIKGFDTAHEGASSHILLPSIAGQFMGGISEKGTGVGFSFDWEDLDAMQISNFKTVGSSYIAFMRRQTIKAGERLVLRATFMTFNGLPTLEGMENDLAGGLTLSEAKGQPSGLSATFVSGSDRKINVNISCRHFETDAVVFESQKSLDLKIFAGQSIAADIPMEKKGLYGLTVTADDGNGTVLRMERAIEVGLSNKSWAPTPPQAKKRGIADASKVLYPARMHKQFRTIDRSFSTPHIPFLANHNNGTIKAFFFSVANPTLSHVREVVQRGDFEYAYKAVEMVRSPAGALNEQALTEFSNEYKAYEPDVLVFLGVSVDKGLRDKHLAPVLKRVHAGMGLVLQTPRPGKKAFSVSTSRTGRRSKMSRCRPSLFRKAALHGRRFIPTAKEESPCTM